ncbi:MAG: hypothetical protein K1X39_10710, partial [Thermoflexales bacterium]|nr:hypothetical protein [Thermoflexales bacterium]
MAAPSEHPIASDVIDLAPQLAALDGASRVWLGEGRAPAAAGHPLLADQRADGGWQPPWAQRAASSGLDATCHRLFQAYAAGLPLDTPALLAATEFLVRAVTAEGPLRENATLLAEAPAWLAAEDPRAARYLAASAGLWLSVFGTADAAKRALAQSRASDEMEFAQTLWQRAALAARLGAPGAADDLALLATRLDTLAVAELAWMLHALALGGLTSGHPLIDAAAARVLAQRDAPGWATPATLAA